MIFIMVIKFITLLAIIDDVNHLNNSEFEINSIKH